MDLRSSPTTSSIIAALVRTTPIRVVIRPDADMMAKVVPRLVEHKAAPAAKAWMGDALFSLIKTYDNPIGSATPVRATPLDKNRFAFKDLKDVSSPPRLVSSRSKILLSSSLTFVDEQQQTQIPQIDNKLLRIPSDPLPTRRAPSNA